MLYRVGLNAMGMCSSSYLTKMWIKKSSEVLHFMLQSSSSGTVCGGHGFLRSLLYSTSVKVDSGTVYKLVHM